MFPEIKVYVKLSCTVLFRIVLAIVDLFKTREKMVIHSRHNIVNA